MGCNFIGIERDAHYFTVAQRRIEQAQMQLPLLEIAG
jgi:DNA modification methylase